MKKESDPARVVPKSPGKKQVQWNLRQCQKNSRLQTISKELSSLADKRAELCDARFWNAVRDRVGEGKPHECVGDRQAPHGR